MASFKLGTLGILVLTATAIASCSNSSFTGNAAKTGGLNGSGTGTGTGQNGSNGTGSTENDAANSGGGSGNGTDSNGAGGGPNSGAKGAGGAGTTTGANSGSGGLTSGGNSATDPCVGDTSAAATAAANSAGPAAKSLLFYAPAAYSTSGGSEATTNDYLNSIVSGLQAAQWNVSVITAVGQSGITFDACSLHKAYKQIWLWLPCNSDQNMDAASLAGVTKYYDYGGGVVVMADNHFLIAGNANTHCDPTDWLGSSGTPSDAQSVSQHMGFALQSGAGGGGSGSVNTTHPLAQALSSLNLSFNWPQNIITTTPSGAIWMPSGSGGAGYASLIDQTISPPSGTPAKLGMIITSMYKYHVASGSDDVTGVAAIASYFDSRVQVTTAAPAGSAGLALTDGPVSTPPPSFNPAAYHSGVTQPSAIDLRQTLISGDKDLTAQGLRGLAKAGAIGLDELMSYNDDNRWLVRFSAAIAAGTLPPADTVAKLKATLHAASLSPDMAIFCARALATAHATEALADLEAAALAFANAPYVSEHNVQGELQAAIRDLKRLGT